MGRYMSTVAFSGNLGFFCGVCEIPSVSSRVFGILSGVYCNKPRSKKPHPINTRSIKSPPNSIYPRKTPPNEKPAHSDPRTTSSFAQIPILGYNRGRKQTVASVPGACFFCAVVCIPTQSLVYEENDLVDDYQIHCRP